MNDPSELFSFTVPERKKIRLLLDTDAKNEADDQYAIVHTLLTPKFVIRGIIGAHFGKAKSARSMEDSCAEVEKLLELMKLGGSVPVLRGAPRAMERGGAAESEGSAAIVAEAMRDDPRPLYCAFLGPLTDMAAALAAEPKIAKRLTVVWIGGGPWPGGGAEYNLGNDVRAANAVMDSDAEVWQIPNDVYGMVRVGLAELQARVMPRGAVGEYLFSQLSAVNDAYGGNPEWPSGESWVLGDSAAVGVLLDERAFAHRRRSAPRIDGRMRYVRRRGRRTIRVYNSVDPRFILEDFYAKLELFDRSRTPASPPD